MKLSMELPSFLLQNRQSLLADIRVYFSVYSWRVKSRLTLCAEMQRFVLSMHLFFVTE